MTWNIRHGGSKDRLPGIVECIIKHDADIVLLTEFRADKGRYIRDKLEEAGWRYQLTSESQGDVNTVLILSREEMRGLQQLQQDPGMPEAKHRWLEAELPGLRLSLLGVHIPGFNDKWGKQNFWESVIKFAQRKSGDDCIILGDFNTGLTGGAQGTPFQLGEYMQKLLDLGWVDSWRHLHPECKEFTWYSSNNGFRLDYAFLSPSLKDSLIDAHHSHAERKRGYSDHSSLILEMDD